MKKIKKVLFVSHGFPCFMSDILFHGLKVLGYDVTEYPQGTHYYGGGSTFGGRKDIGKKDFLSFCYFNFPKKDLTEEQILAEDYDAVILTSWIPEKPWILENIYRRFQGKIPIAFVDGEDDITIRCHFYNDIYFKREFQLEWLSSEYFKDNHKKVKPITFGIIDNNLTIDWNLKRKYLACFIASGHNQNSIRCKIFKKLKDLNNKNIFFLDVERCKNGMLSYEEYSSILKDSYIGISVSGEGFDTYHYYENVYFGSLLFSEQPNIVINNNFINGKNAIFFKNDLSDFNEKLNWYINNITLVKNMAMKGREHLLMYHTSKNRASYIINKLEKLKNV